MGKLSDLKFKCTEKEYCSATKWFYLNNSKIKIDIILSVVLILIGSLFWISGSNSIFNKMIPIFGCIFLLVILFVLYVNPKRDFKKDPKHGDEYKLSFKEEGITFQSEHINSTIRWNNYLELMENKSFFYLIFGKYMFTILPKKSFKNDEEQDLFRKLVNKKLEEVKLHKK